jgi:hypothetical protein
LGNLGVGEDTDINLKCLNDTVRKIIFSIKVYVTLLDYLKFLRSPS